MWTAAAAMLLTLAPCQDGKLAITNLRATYGVPGLVRPDNKVFPGDVLFLSFDIKGVNLDADGKATYSLVTEIKNANGETEYKHSSKPVQVASLLGGDRITAFTQVDVGTKQKAGDYTVHITVKEPNGASASEKATFTLTPPKFALVQIQTAIDAERRSATPVFVVGQTAFVSGAIVGFKRDDKDNPNIALEVSVVDEDGKMTTKDARKELFDAKQNLPKTATSIPLQIPVVLNRPGKFTLQVKIADTLSNESFELKLPISVSEPK